ncbi:MAG TPA: erythromycin esterase family protein [Nitrososphaeraceae archaeon]|nr:erythromycin esterase family protein [Nitrososphaeraceae archaeon]
MENNTILEKDIVNFNKLDNSKDLDILLDHIGDSQFVLLGEASHGTSEFYRWRSEITKRLIKEKGFSFIAVEGDWPDCYKVNRYIKGFPDSDDNNKSAYNILYSFNRWPTWMWANTEIVELVEWLKSFNDKKQKQKLQRQEQKSSNSNSIPTKKLVGFYGLDLYSLWESMEAIIQYLKKIDPGAIKKAIEAYNCFEPYEKDVENYARATAFVPENCEDEVIEMLTSLRNKMDDYSKKDHGNREKEEEYFNVEQNAITAKNAEFYYRTMIRGDVQSWNVRDNHMMETLERLITFHDDGNNNESNSKAIVWAHNTHIGDARATDMAKDNMINLGQLVREQKNKNNTVLIGFGTYKGSVIAAKRWGEKMEEMIVPPAINGSWDNILHNIKKESTSTIANSNNNKLIVFPHVSNNIYNTINNNSTWRGQRAIGVVYNPQYEKYGNYVPTNLSLRYDAFLFIDETHALHPLHIQTIKDEDLPETFPTGI